VSNSSSVIVLSRSLNWSLNLSDSFKSFRVSSCFSVIVCSEWSVWMWFSHWLCDGVLDLSLGLISSVLFLRSFQNNIGSFVAFSSCSILSWWNLFFFICRVFLLSFRAMWYSFLISVLVGFLCFWLASFLRWCLLIYNLCQTIFCLVLPKILVNQYENAFSKGTKISWK
jgi:hypothetical protein